MRSRLSFIAGVAVATIIAIVWVRLPAPESIDVSVVDNPAVMKGSQYRVTTSHSVTVGDTVIEYDAISGETTLYDFHGDPIGSIFSFSYIRTEPTDTSRPVLFVFNGGPGSSSIWLHMGVIGPRRVVLDREVNPSSVPPFGVADNPFSILDVADIVFVDPVGTGFSKVAGKGATSDFWGVDEDALSIAQFIELWLSEHGRWNSPKFILGESYGSIRAALLPRALMGGPFYGGVMRGLTVDGIVLLGTTLSAPGQVADESARPRRDALRLPGIAVTARYHGKSAYDETPPASIYDDALAYASDEYLEALQAQADGTLSDDARQQTLEVLAGFTGLSALQIGDDLVITEREFARLLLADEGLEIGMYDSRYTLPLANSGGDPVADDPAMGRYVPGFVSAFHQMLRDDLAVSMDRPYLAIRWQDLLQGWNWQRAGVAEGQSFAVDLSWAMRRNEDLRVLVASGYYDLVTTPVSAAESLMEVDIPQDRISTKIYESGHMLYLGDTAQQFSEDLRHFITNSD